jgi:DnaK suppressor protein
VSKPPAKSAAPSRKAVGKPAAAAKKAAPPAKKKPAAKPASKVPAKPAAHKPVAKPAAKPSSKPAPKAGAKPVPKAPTKASSAKPAAKAVPPKSDSDPVTKTATKTKTPAATAPVAQASTPHPAPAPKEPKPSARASARAAAAASVPMPDPAPASRFADRFAPMRHARPIAVDAPVRPAVKIDPKLINAWKGKSGRELTEPELLAMPDAEYMNDKQLEFFRVRLTSLKDDLLSNAGETTEHLREDTSIVPDPADRATIEEEHALELRTRDRERKLLKKISQSLARIEAGDYGYCDETGEPLGLARLLARPTATLSLEAQQRREMKQKMFGD